MNQNQRKRKTGRASTADITTSPQPEKAQVLRGLVSIMNRDSKRQSQLGSGDKKQSSPPQSEKPLLST